MWCRYLKTEIAEKTCLTTQRAATPCKGCQTGRALAARKTRYHAARIDRKRRAVERALDRLEIGNSRPSPAGSKIRSAIQDIKKDIETLGRVQ